MIQTTPTPKVFRLSLFAGIWIAFLSIMAKLDQSREDGDSLLDRTTVFLGSNLGDGSSHSTKNLPVLVAGGGFKHGQHLAFDPDNPPPLCNFLRSIIAQSDAQSSTGQLIMIGGGLGVSNRSVFLDLIETAGGVSNARFVLLPAASVSLDSSVSSSRLAHLLVYLLFPEGFSSYE